MKYMAPPKPANRSTQNPLASSCSNCLNVFPSCRGPLQIFHTCENTITADPIINNSAPCSAILSAGMKKADPMRYNVDPVAEAKKLMDSCRKGQFSLVQCSHSVRSASRKVKEPIVQSHAETYAVSICANISVKFGKRTKDPTRNVPPPMKQLIPCHIRQINEFYTVDLGSIQKIYYKSTHQVPQNSSYQILPNERQKQPSLLITLLPPFFYSRFQRRMRADP